MSQVAWLIPALPAASALAIIFFGKRMPKGGAEVGILSLAIAFVLAVVVAIEVFSANVAAVADGGEAFLTTVGVELFPISAEAGINAGIRIDGLSAMMFLLVTFVSLMVHIYSLGYMAGEERFTWYFGLLSLFTMSMLILVVADNLMLLLVGWELVGVCSFLLIGFWWEQKSNSNAAIKAFLTTKSGDVGLVVGVITLWSVFGTFDISQIIAGVEAGAYNEGLLTFGLVALVLGVVGKSAQFPLHTWLPDAMAGPTPVSALIHAATMVTAGVFLIARLYPVYSAVPAAQATIAVIGAITLLMAGLLALVQDDVKKVLAYSTISQLGYMVAALGFSYTAGIFHLFTHGFFKALLFLGAGSIIHAAHSNNMSDMGGLAKVMPRTFYTFLIGSLALMAVPPLAGFWSKDEILVEAAAAGAYTGNLVLVLGAIGGAITVFYMTRVLYLVFAGEFRGYGHPHESPQTMTAPPVALAVPSLFIGLINLPLPAFQPYAFSAWTMFSTEYWVTHPIEFSPLIAFVAVTLAAAGFVVGRLMYRDAPVGDADPMLRLGLPTRILQEKYYLDRLYTDLITLTLVRDKLGAASVWLNDRVIDRIVYLAGAGTVGFGRGLYDVADQKGIDGLVNGVGQSTRWSGGRLRLAQSGNVQLYAGAMLAGVVVLAVVFAVG